MSRILPLLLLSADTDASGIPDCWERWTHTCGMAASADPDGDGLSNLDEFLAQTDPLRADTDGDGLSDADELAGLSSGAPDLDPLVPATFLADEPDTDENGVPDLWEDAGLPNYWGVDAQGFPEYVDFPEPAATNYDVRLTVTSSRHAALDWDDGTLLLPVCTNLVLRLRLGSDAVKTVTLSPAPSAASSPGGAWKASVRAEWDSRRGLPTEGNRIALGDGTMVDRSASESRFVGVLPPPTRTSTPWGLTTSLNGVLCPDWVPYGPKPDSLYPRAFLVSVWSSGSGRPLDTMVLTVFNPEDATEFSTWYTRNLSSWQWASELPPPPQQLPSEATENWHAPETPGRFMHHDAVYELRSKPINGGHGHQATYDGNGILITSTIAAGTADFAAPAGRVETDQDPFKCIETRMYTRTFELSILTETPVFLTTVRDG